MRPSSDGQYLNTNVFKYVFKYISVFNYVLKYISVFTNVFLDTLQNRYLDTVFNYILEYLNTMYLNTLKSEWKNTYNI